MVNEPDTDPTGQINVIVPRNGDGGTLNGKLTTILLAVLLAASGWFFSRLADRVDTLNDRLGQLETAWALTDNSLKTLKTAVDQIPRRGRRR